MRPPVLAALAALALLIGCDPEPSHTALDMPPADTDGGPDAPVPEYCVFLGHGGEACEVEGEWRQAGRCCECGCEPDITCWCRNGIWCCSGDENTDVCFFCHWNEDDMRDIGDDLADLDDADGLEPDDASDADATETTDDADATDATDAIDDLSDLEPPPPPPTPCVADTDCAAGEVCASTSNTPRLCNQPGLDCPPGSICHTSTGQCAVQRCLEPGDCESGAFCVEQRCRPAPGMCTAP